MSDVIDRYAGEYAWLSNGEPAEVFLGTIRCATVEHAYNAAKTLDMDERRWVAAAPAPFGGGPDREKWGAKKRGHHVTLRPGWDEDVPSWAQLWGHDPFPLKVVVMGFLLQQKFVIPHLGLKLLETQGAELIEGTMWCDNFWGRCMKHHPQESCPRFDPEAHSRYGDNNLGRLLMSIRDDLTLVYTG